MNSNIVAIVRSCLYVPDIMLVMLYWSRPVYILLKMLWIAL